MLSPVPVVLVVLVIVIALPVAWFASEFRGSRGMRLTLGCLAILCSFGVAFVVGSLERFNSNAWFGHASKQLVDVTVSELEAGHTNQVLRSFRQLQSEYRPTYENRARYDKLVEQAVADMKPK
jgi:hypothetical protein